mgnify:CR=1 FL=1
MADVDAVELDLDAFETGSEPVNHERGEFACGNFDQAVFFLGGGAAGSHGVGLYSSLDEHRMRPSQRCHRHAAKMLDSQPWNSGSPARVMA